jgi:hypothetical protein
MTENEIEQEIQLKRIIKKERTGNQIKKIKKISSSKR